MSYKENLLQVAEEYCKITGYERSRLGMLILKDHKFFDRIEEGAGCTMDTYEKIMNWVKANFPTMPKTGAFHD